MYIQGSGHFEISVHSLWFDIFFAFNDFVNAKNMSDHGLNYYHLLTFYVDLFQKLTATFQLIFLKTQNGFSSFFLNWVINMTEMETFMGLIQCLRKEKDTFRPRYIIDKSRPSHILTWFICLCMHNVAKAFLNCMLSFLAYLENNYRPKQCWFLGLKMAITMWMAFS